MAPAGNHRRTQTAIDQTFYLTNMSPQVGKGFNRDKWNDVEKHVRKLARKNPNVYIVTGPLYLPKLEADGNKYVKYKVRDTVVFYTVTFTITFVIVILFLMLFLLL